MIRPTLAPLPTLVDQIFREIEQHLPTQGPVPAVSGRPPLLLTEHDGGYRLRVDLPGVAREDITLTFEDQVLSISGTRRVQLQEGERILRSDLAQGPFHASVRFRRAIAADRLTAEFQQGRLIVEIPKREEDKARTIPIAG